MAGTGTISELADTSVVVILAWFEIFGVTACAVGLVSGGWPRNLLAVAAMTTLTAEID